MPIRFDYTNMMAEAVGAKHGISDDELAALEADARSCHEEIVRRREAGELDFYELPFDNAGLGAVERLAGEIRGRFENVVVLGIGGSALGTTAVFHALRPASHNLLGRDGRNGQPRLFVLDNVDPDGFGDCLDVCDPRQTCFLVISKSGSTVETTCQFLVARQWVEESVGETFRDHFVLITDPRNGALRQLAETEGYRSCAIPAGVGGRFSVFTPVGLLPLACVGIDVRALLKGAADLAPRVCEAALDRNPAYLGAALQYLAYRKGQHISVLMPYSDRLRDLADWYRQLWAESLGKKFDNDGEAVHVGPTPVKAVGTTDQHSQVQLYMEGPFDKVVTFLAVERHDRDLGIPEYPASPAMSYLAGHSMGELIDKERQATAAALTKNHRLNATLSLSRVSPETVGALIYLFEVQTLFAGCLFNVNPLDQPGVEEGKHFTYALMGRDGYAEKGDEFRRIQAGAQPRLITCE